MIAKKGVKIHAKTDRQTTDSGSQNSTVLVAQNNAVFVWPCSTSITPFRARQAMPDDHSTASLAGNTGSRSTRYATLWRYLLVPHRCRDNTLPGLRPLLDKPVQRPDPAKLSARPTTVPVDRGDRLRSPHCPWLRHNIRPAVDGSTSGQTSRLPPRHNWLTHLNRRTASSR